MSERLKTRSFRPVEAFEVTVEEMNFVADLECAGCHDHVLIIEAGRTERNYWYDLWRYRELFAILAWRDVTVRYKQAVLGVGWAVIRPLLTMIVFATVFGRLAHLPSDGSVPYPLLVFVGMLPWFLLSTILTDASGSVVANPNLVGKVYFPRIIIPASSAVVAIVDFVINLLLLIGFLLWFGMIPDAKIFLLPLFFVIAVLASLGPALLVASLNVRYRDFRYVIPFIVQFGLYVSPVGFSSAIVPENWRFWYSLNPAVGVVDGFRWCLLGGHSALYVPGLFASLAVAAGFLWAGVASFRRQERTFADVI
jgi:lipopolysaccharide transport system permease protein